MDRSLRHHLRRVIAGDRQAMEWLYDTFASRLWRRLRQRYEYPGGLDAEELLHDAYLYFMKRDAQVIRRYLESLPEAEQSEETLFRYLWNLACGVASNRRRTLKRHRTEVPLPEHWESTHWESVADPDPEQQRIDSDLLARFADCLREKKERVFLYYRLRFVDGLSPKEIAQSTGWSQRTTYRVRQALNEAVDDCSNRLGMRAELERRPQKQAGEKK